MGEGEHPDAMVVIAIVVSRVEALVLANMLETAGFLVCAGGVHHASVEVNSLALGGHRIAVPASQWAAASDLLREIGAGKNFKFCRGLQRAVLRVVGVWFGLSCALTIPSVIAGILPPAFILALPFSVLTIPVNPQGRGDFYLARAVSA